LRWNFWKRRNSF
jgi:hypothetical protein